MKPNLLPKEYLEYISLGAEIAATLLLPILLGYLVDLKLDSQPWALLSGCIVGMILFIGLMIRISKQQSNRNND